jgi:hypothetical protein
METLVRLTDKDINISNTGKWTEKQKEDVEKATKEYFSKLWRICNVPIDLEAQLFIQYRPLELNCCICFEPCDKNNVYKVPCGCKNTVYHQSCLMKWYRVKKICPTCRKSVSNPCTIKVNQENPYKVSKGPQKSIKKYQCDGTTHVKKITYNNIHSALKHIKDKHGIQMEIQKTLTSETDSGRKKTLYTYTCKYSGCEETFKGNGEDFLNHLINAHDLKALNILQPK